MSAKHRHPKARPMADLERRVRRIERNYMRDIVKTARNVARIEIEAAMSAYLGVASVECG